MDESQIRRPRIGIVDIGSNSLRLVIYGDGFESLRPVLNERAICELAGDLERTGKLNPSGRGLAEAALVRFIGIAKAMRVERLDAYATAAIRDAHDGPAFAAHLERISGQPITILSGKEEAYWSARGVLGAIPQARGIIGDLGGGSLELARTDGGGPDRRGSFPLGVLRLLPLQGRPGRLARRIGHHLRSARWLKPLGRQQNLYCVGGSWRALAALHMRHSGHPLNIVHQYAVPMGEALEFSELLTRMNPSSIRRLDTVSRKRRPHIPAAAAVLAHLIERLRPQQVVFSGAGLREGLMLASLADAPEPDDADPLLRICTRLGAGGARWEFDPGKLMDWVDSLGLGLSRSDRRIALAACRLGDFAGFEHPSYRAEQAFLRAFRLSAAAIDHRERALLGLILCARYSGRIDQEFATGGRSLLDPAARRHALIVGMTLRLALSPVSELEDARLIRTGRGLHLTADRDLIGEEAARRLEELAGALGERALPDLGHNDAPAA